MATRQFTGRSVGAAGERAASAFSRVKKKVWCHWADRYLGTADDLVDVGLLRRDQIPGAPGMNRSCCSFYDGKLLSRGQCSPKDERYTHVSVSGKKIAVIKGVPKAVQEQRLAAEQARMDRDRESGRDEAARKAEALNAPTSADAFRSRAVPRIRGVLDSLVELLLVEVGGYRFVLDDEDREALQDAFAEIEQVFHGAAISVNRQRVGELAGVRAHARARDDAPLQHFLQTVTRKARHG